MNLNTNFWLNLNQTVLDEIIFLYKLNNPEDFKGKFPSSGLYSLYELFHNKSSFQKWTQQLKAAKGKASIAANS